MHLVGPYLTTTRYNSKQKKNNSKKLEKSKQEHEAYLKSLGVGKSKPPVDKRGKRVGLYDLPDLKEDLRITVKTSDTVGNGAAREEKRYTGTLIKGIATMHKSNAVPIINQTQAIEVSTMRRN